jgi:GTP-binding protein HflX
VTSPLGEEQNAQVEIVLRELNAQDTPRIRVLNKVDLLPPVQREALRDAPGVVHISAAKNLGLAALLDAIDASLTEDPVGRTSLRIPQSEGKVLAQLEAGARIVQRRYRNGMVELEAEAPQSLLRKIKRFVVQ